MLNLAIYNLEINNKWGGGVAQNEMTGSIFKLICTMFILVNSRCIQTSGVTINSISAEII